MVRRRHDLLVDAQGVVGAAVAGGEEREEAEVGGRGGVAALGAVDVGEREVVLGAGADVAEVLAVERVRAEQGGLEALRGLE